jgi:cell division protein FtsW
VVLIAAPAVALGLLGAVVVASATAHQGAAVFGNPSHFAGRQIAALLLAAAVALAIVRTGPERMLAAAPTIFIIALIAALAVFVPGVGVRAAGSRRWLHIGPLTASPAPLLIAAVALLMAAWGRPRPAERADPLERRSLAMALGLLAVLALVAEPDFSAAAIALVVATVALAGLGVKGRRLAFGAVGLLLVLALVASRFGYVGGRVHGFFAPERDRHGKGFEVLAIARATSGATLTGAGLGHGAARHRLSSPGSDYVFAVVTEEMGIATAAGVCAAWAAVGAGVILAARAGRGDRRLQAAALASGAAALAPAALHIAVSAGWIPIIGVTMPLVSYDPAATVAAGAELGLAAAVALAAPPREPSS